MKIKKMFTGLAVLAGLLAVPSFASAEELTLRVEPGVAIPLTKPQSERFGVGGAVALKPELTIFHWVGLGPSVQFLGLPSSIDGVDTGTAWSYGGFVRVKRPHDAENTSTGWAAVSPWVDTDLKYVRTNGLDRLGWSLAVGAQVPTSDSRWLWVGPFARYDLVNQEDGKVGMNTNSAKTLILGVSFEFGAPAKKSEIAKRAEEEKKEEAKKVEGKNPEPLADKVIVKFKPRIQFAWNSALLDKDQQEVLKDVVAAMLADKEYDVKIEGHASSEGQVEYNKKLAQKRADSVRNFLIKAGVDGKRLTATGFGSSKPVADNKTEAGRIQNRRVEFDVTFTLVKSEK